MELTTHYKTVVGTLALLSCCGLATDTGIIVFKNLGINEDVPILAIGLISHVSMFILSLLLLKIPQSPSVIETLSTPFCANCFH